jgi:hypothetical protein
VQLVFKQILFAFIQFFSKFLPISKHYRQNFRLKTSIELVQPEQNSVSELSYRVCLHVGQICPRKITQQNVDDVWARTEKLSHTDWVFWNDSLIVGNQVTYSCHHIFLQPQLICTD